MPLLAPTTQFTTVYWLGRFDGLYADSGLFMRVHTLRCTLEPAGILRGAGGHSRHRPVLEL